LALLVLRFIESGDEKVFPTSKILLGATWWKGNIDLSLLADFTLDILLSLGLLGLTTWH
jgi:hypothetical protein